jgi:dicarboxylate transporter 10
LNTHLGAEKNNMIANATTEKRLSRWYFGGLASSGAAIVTHPLDLIKVLLLKILL